MNNYENLLETLGINEKPSVLFLVKNHIENDFIDKNDLENSSYFKTGLNNSHYHLITMVGQEGVIWLKHPENSLPAKIQSCIGRQIYEISNMGATVIIETNSEHIINGFRCALKHSDTPEIIVARIVYRNNLGDALQISKIMQSGELSHWYEGLFDQGIKDMDKLMSGKYQGVKQ